MAPDEAGHLIGSAVDRILAAGDRRRAAEAVVLGLTPVDVLALHRLREPEGVTAPELASHLGRSAGGAAAAVARLERRGFVGRRAGPGGRRRVLLRATPAGDAAVAALRAPLLHDLEALVGGLAAGERAAVERALPRLADLYERDADRLTAAAEQAAARAAGIPTPVLWG